MCNLRYDTELSHGRIAMQCCGYVIEKCCYEHWLEEQHRCPGCFELRLNPRFIWLESMEQGS